MYKVNYGEGSRMLFVMIINWLCVHMKGCPLPRGNPYIGPPRPEMKAGGNNVPECRSLNNNQVIEWWNSPTTNIQKGKCSKTVNAHLNKFFERKREMSQKLLIGTKNVIVDLVEKLHGGRHCQFFITKKVQTQKRT